MTEDQQELLDEQVYKDFYANLIEILESDSSIATSKEFFKEAVDEHRRYMLEKEGGVDKTNSKDRKYIDQSHQESINSYVLEAGRDSIRMELHQREQTEKQAAIKVKRIVSILEGYGIEDFYKKKYGDDLSTITKQANLPVRRKSTLGQKITP